MATTTATITLSSADLLSDNLSLSATTTLNKHNTTATGLDEMRMERLEIPIDDYGGGTATQYDLIANSAALLDKPSWVYIANKNTDATHYVTISIKDDIIGKLYAGDWMFIPWSCDLNAALGSAVEIQAYVATAKIEYVLFHDGDTLTAAADS
jgi:hypothetical protein|tara:strand:- start:383 stop:841 length:459 start_codon:yes stop_codon:yes gene_type:complete